MKIPPTTADMFPGLLGELVTAIDEHTEASRVTVASQFLVGLGVAIGRSPYMMVGETRHGVNEFLLVAGVSAQARKGDGKHIGDAVLGKADPTWFSDCVVSGLSSGEGLIAAVRDEVRKPNAKGDVVLVDVGITDKRLLVVEAEFAAVLKMFTREGNTLSSVLRQAWDCPPVLRTMTKQSPARATEPHIGIIGHTTPDDLRHYLADVDIKNGVANRFLYVAAHRARCLPSPAQLPSHVRFTLAERVAEVLQHAASVERMERSPAADELWHDIYPRLTTERPGILGDLCGRAQGHVLRLSMLFALLDQASTINVDHLISADAWWQYCEASVAAIFEGRSGNADADRIKAEMLPGDTLSFEQLRKQVFSNHITAGRLRDALDLLQHQGVVRVSKEQTGGRPRFVVERLATETEAAAG
jgi:Protein of unknown function (DUF3987)